MHFSPRSKTSILLSSFTVCLVIGVLLFTAFAHRTTASHAASSSPVQHGKFAPIKKVNSIKAGPTDADCITLGFSCYSPQEIRTAYGINSFINAGYTGKGQTIVIIDSFGSPTITSDLQKFDTDYGLPNPPSFRVLSPLGTVPFNPNDNVQLGWAEETSLDVEWSHAIAPDANIVLLTSPVAETEGVQGLPEFLELEQYALTNHLGKIFSQSWAATENTLFTPEGKQVIANFENFYQRADAQGVTIFSSTGDSGTANPDVNGNTYPFPTVNFPASSPWVTAVGGTTLNADVNGNYQSETVWNNNTGATGGGISQYFPEPNYQRVTLPQSDQTLLAGHRGIPDISYDADPNTGVPVYLGFLGGAANGYYIFGGTSAGSPQWSGIIADANQALGHSLGFINPLLYRIGASKVAPYLFHDITVGNNGFNGIPGYNATPGWDAATGWGTPNVSVLHSLFCLRG
jgi:subtilase family serine protease